MMIARLVAIAATLALTGCYGSQDQRRNAVETFGFTDYEQGGWVMIGCGRDSIGYRFTAKTRDGQAVRGITCSTILGDTSVRISS